MKRLSLLLIFLLAVSVHSTARAATPTRPNIVLILIDDMGYGDIGPFGSTKNRTPNLDRMAREGMKLTSFYAAPVCSVSRAQVMTGCYGARVSIPGVFGPGSANGISDKESTVAQLLKAQGYATFIIGKWHLGDQPQFLPTRHGFDHYFGLPYSNDMGMKALVNGQLVVPLMRDETVIELLTGEGQNLLTERYTDEAIKFITEQKDHPFFLYLPHTAVHVPIHPGAAFREKSKNGRYGDWVEEVDWSVGKVLDTLNELKLADNTLVMFTSDNGPWLSKGKDAGEAGPLRGGKGSTWEGGLRDPTLAWWPGHVPAGAVRDTVAGTIDLMPTFVTLAGGQIPTDRIIDGRNIAPLLLGQTTDAARDVHYYFQNYKLQAVRSGPWKLVIAPQNESMGKGEAVPASPDAPRLYNLDTDIGERTNLAADHPDVIARLKPLALQMAHDLGDGKPGPQVRPPGHVDHPVTLYPVEGGRRKANATTKGTATTLSAMKPGDTLEGADAPQVLGHPLTISCSVQTTARDGVILAHGGAAVGYALYLKDAHLIFAFHNISQKILRVTDPSPFPAKATVRVTVAQDGAITLYVNDTEVARGKADGPLKRQPQEAFCLGHDTRVTVDAYDGKTLFNGTIENVTVKTDAPPQAP